MSTRPSVAWHSEERGVNSVPLPTKGTVGLLYIIVAVMSLLENGIVSMLSHIIASFSQYPGTGDGAEVCSVTARV